MKAQITYLFLFLFFLILEDGFAKTRIQQNDSLLFIRITEKVSDKANLPTGQLLAEIGKTFLETPYVAHTLENGKDENLIINLRKLDCTTFAENCLAITQYLLQGKNSFSDFKEILEDIRYRDGNRDGYCSRLHYFSDWIYNNQEKGLIEIPHNIPQTSFDGKVNFMSEHPASYKVLKENPELIKVIAEQEKQVSARRLSFLPRSEITKNEHLLKDGDIVGIATSIAGLDVVHVGIVVTKNDRKHLLHASSSEMKVVISENTLHDFLQQKKHYTGVLIARALP